MGYSTIVVQDEGAVRIVRINRPEVMNALNLETLGEVGAAMREADTDDAIRVIVLAGCDKAFAAGADVKAMVDKTYVEMAKSAMYREEISTITAVRKPIIAAVTGYALGGGCELAMCCDMIIAGTGAKFGMPEINLGIIPGMGGTQRLVRAIGKAQAVEMLLTGRFMTADESMTAGLVTRVVEDGEVLETAKELANKIACKPMIAVLALKEATDAAEELPLHDGVILEAKLFQSLFATEDQKEGMAAFLEKRTAKFKHR